MLPQGGGSGGGLIGPRNAAQSTFHNYFQSQLCQPPCPKMECEKME